jgi:hypothetical protein
MAKSVADKLLLKPGTTVWVTPDDRLGLVGPLPEGVAAAAVLAGASAAVVFADDAAAVRRVVDEHGATLRDVPLLWVAYPKGGRADINRDSLWPMLTPLGLRPIGQVAIDDTWSALRFRRLEPGESPFSGGR